MEGLDYQMEEDTIVTSTERDINGDQVHTVDPSQILLKGQGHGQQFTQKRDQLVIHSHSGPSSTNDYINSSHASLGLSNQAYSSYPSDDPDSEVADVATVQVRIPPGPRFPPLPYATTKTGLVYDSRMRFHADYPDLLNPHDIHPEDPRRIHEIFEEIQRAGLVPGPDEPENEKDEHCWRLPTRMASRGEILLIHTAAHYAFVEQLPGKSEAELKALSEDHDSIYFNSATFECARLAAGGAIEACRAVVRGDVRNAIAIIRPPGHHAESDAPSGFCIFNNVPIATRMCQKYFPEKCRKVMILDWDVHHGNGVQHAFYDDPNVLYVSIHVYRDGMFYPSLPDGNYTYSGEGPGQGRNVNIPWADHGMGDAEYIYAFQQVVMPIATEFDPDLVIISAGFDAAHGDVLGGCHVTPACYAHMTHMLMQLAEGKVVACLEGGYNLRSIARSALAVTRTLMQQPPERLLDGLVPKDSAVRTIQQVKRQHSRFWTYLHPKQLEKTDLGYEETRRLHNAYRELQSITMSKEHLMTPLAISKSGLAQSFEHNVIATPDFMGQHPLLVIFHDPPTQSSIQDPVTGSIDLHNTWLTDVTKRYVDWAVKNDFQVIDVNIPKVVSIEADDGDFLRADDAEVRATQTRELASYIYENYIEPHDSTQVFFMGIGAAYLGLVDLLSRYETCTEPDSIVECLIGFVSGNPIQSIKRATDDNIGYWYYDHSLVFVQNSHHVWDPSRVRKIRKKYGHLVQSPKERIDEMLLVHQEDVQKLLLQKKSEFEEEMKDVLLTDDRQTNNVPPQQQPASGILSPRGGAGRTEGFPPNNAASSSIKSPKMPQLGYFSVSSSPRSPLKKSF